MQALRDRIASKLSEKKTKEKDGHSTLKSSASVDGKHATLGESHHHQGSASASALHASASSSSVNSQSAEKGSSKKKQQQHTYVFLLQRQKERHAEINKFVCPFRNHTKSKREICT